MFKKLGQKIIEKKLAGLPPEQREMIMTMIERDPKFFKTLSKEIKAEVKSGRDEQMASMIVMMRHKAKIQKLMQK